MVYQGPMIGSDFEPREATILVTDDDVNNLKVVRDQLASWGCRVLVAKNAAACLHIADTAKPDLILLDVMMPEMNGFEAHEELKKKASTATIPVIFMTALSALEDKVRAFRSGAVDYIVKPIQGEELLGRVAVHLRLQLMTRALAGVNQTLEDKVAERTRKLEEANEKLRLEKAHSDQLADSLRLSLKRAQEADAAKKMFIARVSHELRTPLNVLINLPDILSSLAKESHALSCPRCHVVVDGGELAGNDIRARVGEIACPECESILELRTEYLFPALSQDQFSMFEDMELAAGHLLSQVNDLLDVSQLDSGTMPIHKQRVVVERLLEDSSRAVRALAEGRGLGLEVEAVGSDIEVFGDMVRLRQVLINLIGNAIKFTQAPGTIWLRAVREPPGDVVVFNVEDTGIGIPAESREKIFETFRQLRPGQMQGGTGLGLAISKQIVELHQGKIWVAGRSGPGSSFFFTVPAVPVPDPSPV